MRRRRRRVQPGRGRRGLFPADPGRAGDAAGAARASRSWSSTWAAGLPRGRLLRDVQQYPGCSGAVRDFAAVTAEAHGRGALVTVTADLLALTLLRPPGEWGADVVVGSSQRFGVPLWYGGPHAAFMAVKGGSRARPAGPPRRPVGRRRGTPRLPPGPADREQHIRREKATSNICTAQVLLAVVASMYAVYHGAEGLRGIARRSHAPREPGPGLEAAGFTLGPPRVFRHGDGEAPRPRRGDRGRGGGRAGCCCVWSTTTTSGISCGETTTAGHVAAVLDAFGAADDHGRRPAPGERTAGGPLARAGRHPEPPGVLGAPLGDGDAALPAPPVGPDFALDRGMIPLGLVHHEAQRDHGDGAGRPGRVRRHPPVRAARDDPGLPAS